MSVNPIEQTADKWLFETLLPIYLEWKGLSEKPLDFTLEDLIADYFGDDNHQISVSGLGNLLKGNISLDELESQLDQEWLAKKVLPLYKTWRQQQTERFIDPAEIEALLADEITLDQFLND